MRSKAVSRHSVMYSQIANMPLTMLFFNPIYRRITRMIWTAMYTWRHNKVLKEMIEATKTEVVYANFCKIE